MEWENVAIVVGRAKVVITSRESGLQVRHVFNPNAVEVVV